MDLNCLSPYVRLAWDSIVDPTLYLRERVIFDYELIYIKSGEVKVKVEKNEYHGIPGDIFLFKPKQLHSMKIIGNKPLRQPHIHFDLIYEPDSPDIKVSFKPLENMTQADINMFRKDITEDIIKPFPNHIRMQNTVTFEKTLYEIIQEFENRTPFYEVSIKALFMNLWTQLLREIYWMNNTHVLSNMEILSKVKHYLDSNLDRDISLSDISEYAHMNSYYLTRLFKKAFGITPIQYHLMVRINKAKEMIQFSNLSIGEITEKFGFNSIYSFSRSFKNVEKVPPSFYRR